MLRDFPKHTANKWQDKDLNSHLHISGIFFLSKFCKNKNQNIRKPQSFIKIMFGLIQKVQ